jgi:hypothetical protein
MLRRQPCTDPAAPWDPRPARAEPVAPPSGPTAPCPPGPLGAPGSRLSRLPTLPTLPTLSPLDLAEPVPEAADPSLLGSDDAWPALAPESPVDPDPARAGAGGLGRWKQLLALASGRRRRPWSRSPKARSRCATVLGLVARPPTPKPPPPPADSSTAKTSGACTVAATVADELLPGAMLAAVRYGQMNLSMVALNCGRSR